LLELMIPQDIAPILQVADLDGDHRAEILGLVSSDLWLLQEGGDLLLYSLPGHPTMLRVLDLDGNGDQEISLVVTDQWAEAIAMEPLETEEPELLLLRTDRLPMAAAAHDLDGDGADELLILSVEIEADEGDDPQLRVADWKLDIVGFAGQPREVSIPGSLGRVPWPQDGLAVGDLDGNGHLDLAVGTLSGMGVLVAYDAFGEGAAFEWQSTPLGPVRIVDLDGQGCDELIGLRQGAQSALWILWNGGRK
jgi:hypothetical protein